MINYGTDYELCKTGTCGCSNCIVFHRNVAEKAETVTDKYIPIILGAVGIAICGIYVVATCSLSGVQNIAMAVFTAIVQGVLVAGLSTYVNQVFKQLSKKE